MIKKLLFGILAIMALSYCPVKAQLSDSTHWGCGVSADYFLSKGVDMVPSATAGITPIASFPPSAVKVCGPFTLYYEDLRIAATIGVAAGFADPSVGITCQNTLCSVLNYVVSVFDFSKVVASSGTIRLFIDQSYSSVSGGTPVPLTGSAVSSWGYGASYYDGSITSGIVDGFVHDYITTGVDHNPGDYHGTIKMNFDKTTGWPGSFVAARHQNDYINWSIFNYGLGATTNCQADLYYRLLHLVGHILGMATYHDGMHHAHSMPTVSSLYTSYETAVAAAMTPAGSIMAGWVNNNGSPDNYPTSLADNYHLGERDYTNSLRVSPGDYMPMVMGDAYDWGVMKRQFSKADLLTFKNQVGLSFDPVTFAGSSTSAGFVNNHLPYSDRMASMAYSMVFNLASVAERLPADYTIVNNTATSITIDLTTMMGPGGDLHDADGDPITIMDNSLVNLRGCGSGGNNHNQLTVNPAKNTITFTPRSNFYGRAQFGFNLWDGKEKGAYVIFTINVTKGTAVAIPAGSNIVLNGDFEEGSEVRLLGNAVDNATNGFGITNRGRLNQGQHFADSHPYDCYTNGNFGNAIRGSFQECQTVDAGFGHPYNSFPWTGGAIAMSNPATLPAAPDVAPDAYFPAGVTQNDRYMILGDNGSLLYLGTDLQQCKVYQMEFDIRHRYSPSEFTYPAITPITIGFTDDSHVVDPATLGTSTSTSLGLLTYNQMLPVHSTSGVTNTAWKHETLYFTYCPGTSSNVLYFNAGSSQVLGGNELIDNISIKEVTSIPLTVAVTATPLPSCQTTLSAGDIVNGCTSQTYSWNVKGSSTVLATTKDYTFANPNFSTTYQVTVSDGCHSAVGEYTVKPCPCTPGAVFKAAATTLSGTVSSSLSAGYYYVPANITIAGSPTFTGANILIEPGVTITVANNALLTLNGCHLFTCPDTNKLWNGIVLASGATTSGRIVLSNNTMIEDAVTAIDAQNPKTPASGDIINSIGVCFNRNRTDISIGSYTPASLATYPFTIKSTIFTARLFNSTTFSGYPFSWPAEATLSSAVSATDATPAYALCKNYAKTKCKDGSFSNIGVNLNGVGYSSGSSYMETIVGGGTTSNESTIFDNHGCGIYSYNSNTTVNNCLFLNIGQRMNPEPALSTSLVYDGMGVKGYSKINVNNRLQVQAPPGANRSNYFHDCFIGIDAEGITVFNVSTATITSSHTLGVAAPGDAVITDYNSGYGIRIIGSPNMSKCSITSNTISNMNTGIYTNIVNPKSGATINIDYNSLYAANTVDATYAPYTANQYMLQAIDVYSPVASNTASLSASYNGIYNAYNGIHLNSLYSVASNVNHNNITLLEKPTAVPQYGIQMEGCINNSVRTNTVTSTTTAKDLVRGFYFSGTSGNAICDNVETNVGRGFEFANLTGQPSTWTTNNMTNNWKGLALGSPIGNQVEVATYVVISPMLGMVKITGYACGNKWLLGWSSAKPQTYATVDSRSSVLYTNTGIANENPTFNVGVPSGSLAYTTVGGGPLSIGPKASLVPATKPTQVCYPNGVIRTYPPPIASIPYAYNILADNSGYDPMQTANQWMAQFALWRATLADSTIVLADSSQTFANFTGYAAGSRYKWLSDIEAALANSDIASAESLLASPAPAAGRLVVDSNLVITDTTDADYVVATYVSYYNSYLDYIKGNPVDMGSLFDLANLCPATYGDVVYQARGLHRLLSDTLNEYNDDSCMYNNFLRISKGADMLVQSYALYPNPNDGNLTLYQGMSDKDPVQMQLYDLQGRVIYRTTLIFGQSRQLQLHLQGIETGMYLVQLRDSKGKNYTIKCNVR